MSNVSRDVKKSLFAALTTIPAGSTLDFVSNGTNYKITVEDMIAAFGTTGSLEQLGSVSGTAVLSKSGSVNRIRNIEDGPGVKGSVSPEQGVKLEHNIAAGTEGVEIFTNRTELQPLIRNLLAGTGINLAVVGDAIQVSATGITVASNIVVVNQMSDFPTAVSGVITLEDDTAYLVSAKLTTTDRFEFGDNCVLYAADSSVGSLTYTGAGTMLTANSENSKVTLLTLDAPNGQLLDVTSGSGNGVFQLVNATIKSCDAVGSIGNLSALQITDTAFEDVKTDGLSFTGTIAFLVGSRNLFTVNGGTMFKLGSSTISAGFTTYSSLVVLAAGTNYIDGLVDSGNFDSGALGSIFNMRFSGSGTPLAANITRDDPRWQFFGNDDIGDTRPDGLLSFSGNATNTVIASTGVPVLIAGTWVEQTTSQFEATAAGRLTYKGGKPAKLPITASLTGAPVSGTNKTITYHLYKNGVDLSADQSNIISSGSPKNTSLIWQLELNPDDYLELFVSNDTDTIDVLVSTAVFRIN